MAVRNYTDGPIDESTQDVTTPVYQGGYPTTDVNSSTDSSALVVTDPTKNTIVGFNYDRAMDLMTPDAKQEMLAKAKKNIDLDNPATIRQYGQDLIQESEKVTDRVLAESSSDPTIPLIKLTNDLKMTLDEMTNPQDPLKPQPIWKRLPILRHFVKKVKEVQIERKSPDKNLDDISAKFAAMKAGAMSKTVMIDDMLQMCRECVVDSREKILELMCVREELQEQMKKLDAMEVCDLDELQRLRDRDHELSKRITLLATSEHLFQQSMVQNHQMMRNYNGIIDKCDEERQLIPIVKMQVANGVEIERQHRYVDAIQSFEDYTNETITTNAHTLRDQSLKLAKMTETSGLKIESIDDAKRAIIDMYRGCEQISKDGEKMRTEVRQALQKMTEELHAELRRDYI